MSLRRVLLVHVLSLFPLGSVLAQAEFVLGFSGPASLSGPTGSVQSATYFCTLTQIGPGPGAQGWQIILRAPGATITAIDPLDTDAEAIRQKEPCFGGGLPGSFVTNQMGGGKACSAVVLGFCIPTTLVAGSTATIARIQVQAVIPECGGSFGLEYVDEAGCFAGVASTNVITQQNASHSFTNGLLLQETEAVGLDSTDPCDPATLLAALIVEVEGLGLESGAESGLLALLGAALRSVGDASPNNDAGAVGALNAFIAIADALPGEVISEEDAQALIADAQQIIDLLSAS